MSAKPLREAFKFLLANIDMQIKNVDVAIPFLRGKPGGGKTGIITNYCLNNPKVGFLSTHFAIKPIEETGGIPRFKKIKINGHEFFGTQWTIPDIIMTLYSLAQKYEKVIWLLDDSHLLSSAHMTLLYELFTERSIRGYRIPSNVGMCMAGNTSNKAGAKTLFSAIVNRVMFMDVYTPFEHWKEDFAIPNNVNPIVVSFLQYETHAKYFHEDEKVDKPWGSPRSWTRLGNMIDGLLKEKIKLTTQDILYLAQGHIGDGASEFTTYWEIYSKFNFNKILSEIYNGQMDNIKNMNNYEKYVMTSGLIKHYIDNVTTDKSKLPRKELEKIKEREKWFTRAFAKFIIFLFENFEDLAMLTLRECWIYEKELKKRFMQNLINDIYNINKESIIYIRKFFKEVQEAVSGGDE